MNDTTYSTGDTGRAHSGRFILRIDPGLHGALRAAAREAGVSLNEYCARKLAAPGVHLAGPAIGVVRRAAALVGEALVGLVVFGSWSRDELTAASDVDVLVILDARVTLTRELYRSWDEEPVSWEGWRVEPHFVRLADIGGRVPGIWAEAAVDGIVLFERGLEVSRRLVAIRRRIVDGTLVRRRVHGQPYWVHAA